MMPRYSLRMALISILVLCVVLAALYPPITTSVTVELNQSRITGVRNTATNAIAAWYRANGQMDPQWLIDHTHHRVTDEGLLILELSSPPYAHRKVYGIALQLADHLTRVYSMKRPLTDLSTSYDEMLQRMEPTDPRHDEFVASKRSIDRRLRDFQEPRVATVSTDRSSMLKAAR